MALPLFIFFFCNILGILDIIRLQSVMFAAVRETGTQICEYAYYLASVTSGENAKVDLSEIPEGISSLILSETYVRSSVRSYLGEDYITESPIRGDSISFLGSSVLGEDDVVSLIADYRVEPFISLIAPESFSMQTRFVGHAWTGYALADSGDGTEEGDEEDPLVYITPSGTVYHMDSACTYLKPRVRQTAASEIDDKRSADGSCYYACESCRPAKKGVLYYTTDGNRYHSTASCSRLKRTVDAVHLSEVEGSRRACSKCSGT